MSNASSLRPVGPDLLIKQLVEMEMMSGVSSQMIGLAPPPRDFGGLEAELLRLVSEGGAIERSNAAHVCAACGKMEEMNVLLRVAGTGNANRVLNAKNEKGMTPLMVAASSATTNFLFHVNLSMGRPTPRPEGICDQLVSRGADKSLVDDVGLTALGHMREKAMDYMQFAGGFQATMTKLEVLTRILMPLTGPTLADANVLQAGEYGDDVSGDY
jgi:hypothetical protein